MLVLQGSIICTLRIHSRQYLRQVTQTEYVLLPKCYKEILLASVKYIGPVTINKHPNE